MRKFVITPDPDLIHCRPHIVHYPQTHEVQLHCDKHGTRIYTRRYRRTLCNLRTFIRDAQSTWDIHNPTPHAR